jgi:hypothetical protein
MTHHIHHFQHRTPPYYGRLAAFLIVVAIGLALFVVACGGDSDPPADAPEGGADAPGTSLTITAENNLFDEKRLVAPANTPITLDLVNQDAGVLHNVAVYRVSSAREVLFMGDLFPGVATRTYKFTTPSAGSYFFRCDVHPDMMTGSFVTR